MASYTGDAALNAPSAPPMPDSEQPPVQSHPPPSHYSMPYHASGAHAAGNIRPFAAPSQPPPQAYGFYPYHNQPRPQQNFYGAFPPGTHPDLIAAFQMVDRNQSGYIEETELQGALARNYPKLSLRTLRLLIFLFRNPNESSSRIGPKEFADMWNCLAHWQAIFGRFDRDHSGKIDAVELRDALYNIGYLVPPSVLQVLISRYDDDTGSRVELGFDSFVECGMIVKGLTEKFKEKDARYTGSATLSYDAFMSMIIPFIVSD